MLLHPLLGDVALHAGRRTLALRPATVDGLHDLCAALPADDSGDDLLLLLAELTNIVDRLRDGTADPLQDLQVRESVAIGEGRNVIDA